VFPLVHAGVRWGHAVPAWWSKTENGDLTNLGVLPLFYYHASEDQDHRMLITPLGGRGWSDDEKRHFVNVLGPVFHYHGSEEGTYLACAWPLFSMRSGEDGEHVSLFPLAEYDSRPTRRSLASLAGLIKYRIQDAVPAGEHPDPEDADPGDGSGAVPAGSGLRIAPLFSYNREVRSEFLDFLTVFAWHEVQGRTRMSLGTPLLFHYREDQDRLGWSSLLGILDYDSRDEESDFSFLWFLYRQKQKGEQVRRDLFPFVTWDSGPERSGPLREPGRQGPRPRALQSLGRPQRAGAGEADGEAVGPP
jgi:hypothetical protein